jgi:cytidylate kinase
VAVASRGPEPVVTLDGPAGSGKSTTAKEVARRLGLRHLDSGAFYRALTWALLDAGIDEARWPELTGADLDARRVSIQPGDDGFRILVADRELGDELRSREVTARVSELARLPAVRDWLLDIQRRAGAYGGLVADGRDMGTVVFPDAEVKVFLTADLEERARRRLRDHGRSDPTPTEVDEEARRIDERDRMDSEREVSPLRRPPDAHVLDTSRLDFDAQVEAIVALVAEARAAS